MSEIKIHPTALVSPEAVIGEGSEIGAFSIIGPQVKLGKNSIVHHHVTIEGNTTVGDNNKFFQYCSIGAPPQDTSYKNEPTEVIIGDNNTFREYVSIHRGTLKEEGKTRVGSNSLLMAYVHLGHDVVFGNNCVIANSVNLAGHVRVGDRVIIGGGTNISQFCSIGRGAYIGGASAIDRDVPIFCTAYGNRIRLKGINIIGMRRAGYDKPVISEVVDFFRAMEASPLSPRSFVDHEELMEEFKSNEIIQEMVVAIRTSEVGIAPFVS